MRKTELRAALFALAFAAFAQGDAPGPPSRVARLNYLSGSVSFRPGTVDEWMAATLNYPVYNGDRLWADRGARTELHIGSTALRMDSETALAVLNLDDRMVQLGLTGGTLEITLRSLADGESFEVDTPNAAVTLLRAGEYRFFVDGDRDLTAVTVRSGDAEVTGSGRAFTLHARDSARLAGVDDTFSSEVNAAAPPDDFDFLVPGPRWPRRAIGIGPARVARVDRLRRSGRQRRVERGSRLRLGVGAACAGRLGSLPRRSLGVGGSVGLDLG